MLTLNKFSLIIATQRRLAAAHGEFTGSEYILDFEKEL
jgi:hypothetical protein